MCGALLKAAANVLIEPTCEAYSFGFRCWLGATNNRHEILRVVLVVSDFPNSAGVWCYLWMCRRCLFLSTRNGTKELKQNHEKHDTKT